MKKMIALVLCVVLACISVLPVFAAEQEPVTEAGTGAITIKGYKPELGDVNRNGVQDVADIVLMRKHFVGSITLSGAGLEAAHVTREETISSEDIVALKKILLGIPV